MPALCARGPVQAVAALADMSVVQCWTREAVGERRAIGLDPAAIGLLREAVGSRLPQDAAAMAALVKAVPVVVTGTMPIDRAISTAGGIAWSEVDDRLMLHRIPGTFVPGEMLAWEAPTGGYLRQASFSTGVLTERRVLARLES